MKQTLARPYAKAIFALAQQTHTFEQWSENLALAAQLMQDAQLVNWIKNPHFDLQQIMVFFKDASMQNLLHILEQFKRLTILPQIADFYEAMREEHERVIRVKCISAFALDDAFQQHLIALFQQRMNCQVKLECSIDPTLLAGAIIRAGDWIKDGSLQGRLVKMNQAVN